MMDEVIFEVQQPDEIIFNITPYNDVNEIVFDINNVTNDGEITFNIETFNTSTEIVFDIIQNITEEVVIESIINFEVNGEYTGLKGDKGDKGVQGLIGNTGNTGNTGNRGLTGEQGDMGLKGDTGMPGSSYIHYQSSSSINWYVNHNLNKYPPVTILDSTGEQVGADINYIDLDNLVVKFKNANSGIASM